MNDRGQWTVNGVIQTIGEKIPSGHAGELLSGNPAVANGNFDAKAYGYENHINKLLFEVPFRSREEIAVLFGGERKTRDGDFRTYGIWYNGVNDEHFNVFFDPEDGTASLTMPIDMALDFYQDSNLHDAFDYIASEGGFIANIETFRRAA